jgi:hypothetical protein
MPLSQRVECTNKKQLQPKKQLETKQGLIFKVISHGNIFDPPEYSGIFTGIFQNIPECPGINFA